MSVWIALVVLALPMLYRRAFTYLITRRSSQRPAQQTPAAPKSSKRLRFALVTLVSIVCICRIAIFRPRSIFDILDLPFGAPSSTIWDRLIIVYGYNPDYLPAQTAALLMRLKTLQGRQLYHHWGDLVAQPEMPSDDSQLILLQLPGLVGAYAATTAAIGWLACDQGREKWRIYLCILLAAAFGAEVYASRQPWDSNLFVSQHGPCLLIIY